MRNARPRNTARIVSGKSDSLKVRPACRSTSKMARNGCNKNTNATQAAALDHTAPRQPNDSATVGPNAPPSSKPIGTPVWRIENINGASFGGDILPKS